MTLQPHPRPHRLSTCRRHPSKPVTGFCASCLRERLAGIDNETRQEISVVSQQSGLSLRRSKSYSSAKSEAILKLSDLPRRKSCDVRGARNTLWDLFSIDDESNGVGMGSLVFEVREDVENGIETRASGKAIEPAVFYSIDDFVEAEGEFKTMKEFIDLEWRSKKKTGKDLRDIAGSVWEAASVFSKKLRKWKRKHKMNNPSRSGISNAGAVEMQTEKPSVRPLRDTQSEVGDYGLRRRSCDTDPRFSIDAGRFSLDNSRYSFEEPRASWDGYLIGRAGPRMAPMASVLEEAKFPGIGYENKVLEEAKLPSMSGWERSPGGSAQTQDYYMESLSSVRRRRSFDRSNSYRKGAVTEIDELKLISNAKVSPATTELFYGAKLLITEEDLKDSNSKSTEDGNLDGNECGSKDVIPDAGGVNQKAFKRSHKWSKVWNVLGLIQKRSESKCGDDEISMGRSSVDQPLAESWLSKVANGEANGSVSQKLIRSYSVSCRVPNKTSGLSSAAESKGNGLRRREELMLHQNRNVRYSPNHLDNGLLRFYLTPLRSYGRSKSVKSKLHNSHCITKNVL